MSWIKSKWPFFLLTFSALWIMIISIFDVIFDKGWMNIVIAVYAIILVLVIFLIFIRSIETREETKDIDIISEFEKTLKGGLYHFKCPTCTGIFAIKKSKRNDKKYVKMTCPDCGAIGIIPPYPAQQEEEIPEKKSIKVNFRCNKCGEGITIWAEGTELYQGVHVFSCPYCGDEETMEKI